MRAEKSRTLVCAKSRKSLGRGWCPKADPMAHSFVRMRREKQYDQPWEEFLNAL
jgi:hypothetical protein